MPRARTFDGSRSRSRTASSSEPAARFQHPLALHPQPQNVRSIRAWVSLNREVHALRITLGFMGLLIAATYGLPVTLSVVITARIAEIPWIRRTTYARGPPVNIIEEGTAWLRHHAYPLAQLIWLCAETSRYTWNLRHFQRTAIRRLAEAMIEYLTTFLSLDSLNTLDVDFVGSFADFVINMGNALHNQLNVAETLLSLAPGRLVQSDPSLQYYIGLHTRDRGRQNHREEL